MTGEEHGPPAPAIDAAFLAMLSEDIGAEECGRILRLFMENLREYCGQMEGEIAANDIIKTKRTAHGIKGLCLQFGATHSMEIARLIELKVETAEEAKAALDKLVAEITRVEDFVKSWGSGPAREESPNRDAASPESSAAK